MNIYTDIYLQKYLRDVILSNICFVNTNIFLKKNIYWRKEKKHTKVRWQNVMKPLYENAL